MYDMIKIKLIWLLSVSSDIKLRDGRHLAYKEHGVSSESANYKIIIVHGFASTKHDTMFLTNMIPVHHFYIYLLIWLLAFPS